MKTILLALALIGAFVLGGIVFAAGIILMVSKIFKK
jgi:hypothetical protein